MVHIKKKNLLNESQKAKIEEKSKQQFMMVPDHICKSRDGPWRVSELSPSLVLAWAAPCSFRGTSLTSLCLRIHLRMVGFIIVPIV